MISVLMCCYSKQELLNQTLYGWLNQRDVDYEIVLVHGPKVVIEPHKLIVPVEYKGKWNICKGYNLALAKSRGDIIVTTQCDMLLKSFYQLKRMFTEHKPDRMVKESDFPFLHLCMVSKKALTKAGGWHEPFGDYYGYEDTDLVATLTEQGIKNYYIYTGDVSHLKHNKPDFTDELRERYAKSRALFEARHK